jgi:hypothetical protein
MEKVDVTLDNIMKGEHIFEYEGDKVQTGIPFYSLEERRSWMYQTRVGPGGGYNVELFASKMVPVNKPGQFFKGKERCGHRGKHEHRSVREGQSRYVATGLDTRSSRGRCRAIMVNLTRLSLHHHKELVRSAPEFACVIHATVQLSATEKALQLGPDRSHGALSSNSSGLVQ